MTAKRKTPFQRRKMGTRSKLRRVNIEQNATRAIRPRLSVHRTNKQIYAQVIDDIKGVTLAAASSLDKDAGVKSGHTVDAAAQVGKLVAERAVKAGVKKVQFDRGGFVYHGRIKAIADGAREGGLEF
jgi:large subunit ribosomal protein L18